jgi:protein involved in polysaccharide export with SLBB domain
MHKATARYPAVWLLALAAGCTSTGNRFALFPEGHRLTHAARSVRLPVPPDVPRELDKGVARPYTVEPGDVLLVQPASLDSPVRLPGDQPILPDGSIQLGRYGRLLVAGKTVEQIEWDVNHLIGGCTPDAGPIAVRLVTRDSKVFYVLGEVNAPGAFPLKGRETVLDAILCAGGLNSNAARRHIILSRPTRPDDCRIVLPVCYNEIVQLGDTTTNYQILAGDRIYVPSRSCWEDLLPWKCCCEPCRRPQVPCCGSGPSCNPAGVAPPPPVPPPPARPLPPREQAQETLPPPRRLNGPPEQAPPRP